MPGWRAGYEVFQTIRKMVVAAIIETPPRQLLSDSYKEDLNPNVVYLTGKNRCTRAIARHLRLETGLHAL